MGWDLKEYKLGNRIYKAGNILTLHSDGTRELKVIVRKVVGDKIWHSMLKDDGIPMADDIQGFVYDYRVKKIEDKDKEKYPPNFKVAFLDWWEDVVNFVTGIPYNIKSFFWEIKQFFRWGWFMRKNWDWDWGFFLSMVDKKLADMENHQRKDAHHVSRYSCARQIALTRKYLKRVQDGSTEDKWHELFEKKYGKQGSYFQKSSKMTSRWMHTEYSKCENNPEKQAHAEKVYRRLIIKTIPYYVDKDRKILFWLLYKYLPYWWD